MLCHLQPAEHEFCSLPVRAATIRWLLLHGRRLGWGSGSCSFPSLPPGGLLAHLRLAEDLCGVGRGGGEAARRHLHPQTHSAQTRGWGGGELGAQLKRKAESGRVSFLQLGARQGCDPGEVPWFPRACVRLVFAA